MLSKWRFHVLGESSSGTLRPLHLPKEVQTGTRYRTDAVYLNKYMLDDSLSYDLMSDSYYRPTIDCIILLAQLT